VTEATRRLHTHLALVFHHGVGRCFLFARAPLAGVAGCDPPAGVAGCDSAGVAGVAASLACSSSYSARHAANFDGLQTCSLKGPG
jgi:hypothetical protein